jgi:cell division protein FtsZ
VAEIEEPDLFEAPAFQPQPEPEEVLEHDLPPPVYRPQPAAQAPAAMARPTPQAIEADAGDFVAPRPRGVAGQPSPEALARLQAAVSKNPAMTAQRPVAQRAAAPQPAAPQPAAAGGKPRFGIGSLINRMAGHLESAGERGQPQAGRVQPPVASYDDEPDQSGDDNRIEIPAFLRRQAN